MAMFHRTHFDMFGPEEFLQFIVMGKCSNVLKTLSESSSVLFKKKKRNFCQGTFGKGPE